MEPAPVSRRRIRVRSLRVRSQGRLSGFFSVVVAIISAGVLTGSTPNFTGLDVPEPPSDPNTLVLQLHLWRSMSGPPELAELPEFSLYGGGRVIVGNAWDGSLHRAWEYTLSPDRYRQIYRLAHAAGLARSRHLPEPEETTDGTLLVAELRSAGRLHTTTVVSLGRRFEIGARRRIAEFHRPYSSSPARRIRPDLRLPAGRAAVLATATGSSGASAGSPSGNGANGDLQTGVRSDLDECTTRSGAAVPVIEALGRGTPWAPTGCAGRSGPAASSSSSGRCCPTRTTASTGSAGGRDSRLGGRAGCRGRARVGGYPGTTTPPPAGNRRRRTPGGGICRDQASRGGAGDGNRTRTVSLGTVQDHMVARRRRELATRPRAAWSDPEWPSRMARQWHATTRLWCGGDCRT